MAILLVIKNAFGLSTPTGDLSASSGGIPEPTVPMRSGRMGFQPGAQQDGLPTERLDLRRKPRASRLLEGLGEVSEGVQEVVDRRFGLERGRLQPASQPLGFFEEGMEFFGAVLSQAFHCEMDQRPCVFEGSDRVSREGGVSWNVPVGYPPTIGTHPPVGSARLAEVHGGLSAA